MGSRFPAVALVACALLETSSGHGLVEKPVMPLGGPAVLTTRVPSGIERQLVNLSSSPLVPEYHGTGLQFCSAFMLCMISWSLLLVAVGWRTTSRRGQACGNFTGEADDGHIVTLNTHKSEAEFHVGEIECKLIDGPVEGNYGIKDAYGGFRWALVGAGGCTAAGEQRASIFLESVYGPLSCTVRSYTVASRAAFVACMACTGLAVYLVMGCMTIPKMMTAGPVLFQGLSSSSYSVPASLEVSKELSDCGCAVFFGRITVFPIVFNILSVVFNFTVNFMITFAKTYWSGKKWPVGDLLWQALRAPSAAFIVPSFLLQLFELGTSLALTFHNFEGWMAYNAFYMQWINSGMAAFVGAGIVGGFTTNALHENLATNVRTYGSAGFLLLSAPAFFTHVLPAMLCWPWLALTAELSLSLLLVVCLPVRALYIEGTLMDLEAMRGWQDNWGVCLWMIAFLFFPMLQPVLWASKKFGMLACRRSPFGPGMRTMVLALYVLGKVLLWQTLFNVSTAWYFGVDYWDAASLNVLIRHWHCHACLMESSAQMKMQTFVSLARWLKFATLF